MKNLYEYRELRNLKRLAIPLLLILLLLAACNTSFQSNAPVGASPGTSSSQIQTVAPSLDLTREPEKNPAQQSVYPPSLTPTVRPSLTPTPTSTSISTNTPTPEVSPTPTQPQPLVFAVIGDYGSGEPKEGDVAKLVDSWKPEFVISVGDNNYPTGAADHLDKAVGQFYHDYIYPYGGSYGNGADVNRFFPVIGNHDMLTNHAQPYLDYFSLPGNERYYDFVWGPVHFFAMNNVEDPDGVGASSAQAQWLKQKLAESTSPWNIVYTHYSPYSSGYHGSIASAQWPFKEWGADIVLTGHDHVYERLQVDGLTYIVNGLGGVGFYKFKDTVAGSLVRYNDDFGAMRVEATDTHMKFEFITRAGEVIDTYEMDK